MDQVSRGTLEQIYFAIRMAATKILHEGECPVILDDTFGYYDDSRLAQTLRWLKDSKRQVSYIQLSEAGDGNAGKDGMCIS